MNFIASVIIEISLSILENLNSLLPLSSLYPPPTHQDKRAVERLSLEKAFHPFIAGAHNRLVQELSQETGARISIPPPSLPKDEIVITGEKEAVALAVNRIRAIYDDKVRLFRKDGFPAITEIV